MYRAWSCAAINNPSVSPLTSDLSQLFAFGSTEVQFASGVSKSGNVKKARFVWGENGPKLQTEELSHHSFQK